MKILIFSHEFPPDIGGAGVVAEQNAKILAETGNDVTVLTRYRESSLDNDLIYSIKRVKTYGKLWFITYKNAVDFSEYDLILLNDPASLYIAGLYFNKEIFDKSTAFLHGSEPELIYKKHSLFRSITFFKFFYTKALTKVKHIISVSHFMKEKFLSNTNLHSLSSKMIVNYAGIDSEVFSPEKNADLKQELSLPQGAQLLISVSRLVTMKGYPEMLNIFEKLLAVDNDFYWAVVGTGEYLEDFKKEIKMKKLESRVFLLGPKKRSELRYYYSGSDVFWLLSNYEESFGLSYLEAQACGIPAIGFNKCGVKEAISVDTGFLIDTADEIIPILVNKKYKNIQPDSLKNFICYFNGKNLTNNLLNLM